jgi:replication factor A1
VYYISRGQLKTANKQYNTTNNEYEMTLGRDTVVERCDDEADDIPSITFNFVPINEMEKHQPNSIVGELNFVSNFQGFCLIVAES